MKKSSDVLGLKIMGIKEGTESGLIHDFMIDPETASVEYLMIKTERGYGFRALKIADVMGIGTDYVMTGSLENAKKLYESPELLEEIEKGFFMMGTMVLSSSGDVIGSRVQDFIFDEKDGKIHTLLLDNNEEFSADTIASLAGGIVVVDVDKAEGFSSSETATEPSFKAEPVPEPKPEPAPAPKAEPAPAPKPEPAPAPKAAPAPVAAPAPAPAPAPKVAPAPAQKPAPAPAAVASAAPKPGGSSAIEDESAAFLLGKTVKTEVASDDGAFKINAGTVLTQEIINLAKKHDVILTLTLNV